MPTYGYRCTVCQHVFEQEHSIREGIVVICPKCDERAMRIVTNAPAILGNAKDPKPDADTSSSEEDGANNLSCGCVLRKHCSHTD